MANHGASVPSTLDGNDAERCEAHEHPANCAVATVATVAAVAAVDPEGRRPGDVPRRVLLVSRVIIVGAGVLGTMHAWEAVRRGWDVVLLDRDPEPRGATVRNFGLVWVSGRAVGDELESSLRARELWERVGRAVPGVGFRPDGSLTVVRHPAEVAVLEEVCARRDAGERGVRMLDPDEARRVNPALRGTFLAAMHCTSDAVVEPREVLPSLREHLRSTGDLAFLGGRTALEVDAGVVVDQTGTRHAGDLVLVCPGAAGHDTIAGLPGDAPLRRVRLQMLQTAPLGDRCTTALADGDTLRYYPAFRTPALASLPEPTPAVARYGTQLLVAQRSDGRLTVGDTHEYDEPFAFDLAEAPYEHLAQRVSELLGRPLPAVERRWSGVYAQALDEALCWRSELRPDVWVVNGPGGRGMTLAPALAEETWQLLDLN